VRSDAGPDGTVWNDTAPCGAVRAEATVSSMPPQRDDDVAAIRALVAEGESLYVEFKSAWIYDAEGKRPRPLSDVARDVAVTIVAFANADGGDLVIGVEDGGRITGVPFDEHGRLYLGQVPSRQVTGDDGLGVGALVREVEVDGLQVLWFRVSQHAGSPLITQDGRCLMRRGKESSPVPPAEVERRRMRILGDGGYESEPVPQASVDDLDLELLRSLTQPIAHLRGFDDPKRLLRYWGLVDGRNGSVILRRAALLLFARDPLRWHPNNRVRIRWVLGDDPGWGAERRTREREVIDAIPRVLPQVKRILGEALERESLQDGLFRTSTLLPETALEECLVNAVVHRNYAVAGQAIEILLHPHHVEFRSPGGIPEPLTLDELREARGNVHRTRNPVMMRVLRDLGWARDQGEGIRRIFGSIRQAELHEPELEVVADTFIVRLSTRSIYDEATQSWITAYSPFQLRPEERRHVIALRRAKGRRAVDPLARDLGEAYDTTKQALADLERRGIVWHASGTRTYHLVEPLEIPFERAYRRMAEMQVAFDPSTRLSREGLQVLLSTSNQVELGEAITRWKEQGILAPEGRQWKLGSGMLEYARRRAGRSR
jgi:ATP-dependent DNA helicase RecG